MTSSLRVMNSYDACGLSSVFLFDPRDPDCGFLFDDDACEDAAMATIQERRGSKIFKNGKTKWYVEP